MQTRLLYRDGLILVLDKPAGLPVHAGPGGGDNLERHFDGLRFGLPHPPALAHRLDRDTSGCLVLGRHRKALSRLGKLFQGGLVEKTYGAIVVGAPAELQGRVEARLRKESSRAGGWRMVVDPAGQHAVTDWRVLGRSNGLSWLELKPQTGRTHQIRVHCAELGCPILGEPQYAPPPPAAPAASPDTGSAARRPPLHLHARRIILPLYANKPPIDVSAPPPSHMSEALVACGYAPPRLA